MLLIASITLYLTLEFSCSYEEECEALIIGLISTLQIRIHKIWVQGDSRLIIENVNEKIALKEIAFVYYQNAVQNLITSFSHIQFEHVP